VAVVQLDERLSIDRRGRPHVMITTR
jgi:hypothetical protein